jgi:hypothetical protein
MHEPYFQYILQGHFGRKRRPHLAGDPNTVNELELIQYSSYFLHKKGKSIEKKEYNNKKMFMYTVLS